MRQPINPPPHALATTHSQLTALVQAGVAVRGRRRIQAQVAGGCPPHGHALPGDDGGLALGGLKLQVQLAVRPRCELERSSKAVVR